MQSTHQPINAHTSKDIRKSYLEVFNGEEDHHDDLLVFCNIGDEITIVFKMFDDLADLLFYNIPQLNPPMNYL